MLTSFKEFAISSLVSFLFVAIILPRLRKRLLDKPNQRSSHRVPTPRGGGIAFVIVGSILNYICSSGPLRWLPILCLPLALIGLLDDYKDVSALWRYTVQIMTAVALLHISRIDIPAWYMPLCIILITGVINFMNFMDGLDGLLAGCSVLLFAAASNWSISGAIFGFLLWNWSPAKVFMGDVGSTFIGAAFAGLAFQQPTSLDFLSFLLLGFPLFGDAAICVLRRLFTRQNIFTAHRQHLYQRLNRAGWNHASVAFLYILAVFILVLGKAMGHVPLLIILIIAEFIFALILDQKVAISFEEA
jgi:Fuc2NAc and GlcNAc transferase